MRCDSVTGCHLSISPPTLLPHPTQVLPPPGSLFCLPGGEIGETLCSVSAPFTLIYRTSHAPGLREDLVETREAMWLSPPHGGVFSAYLSLKNRNQCWLIWGSTALAINTPHVPAAHAELAHILSHTGTCECLCTHRDIHTFLSIGTCFSPGQGVCNGLYI